MVIGGWSFSVRPQARRVKRSQPAPSGGRVALVNATPRFLQLADVAEILNISGGPGLRARAARRAQGHQDRRPRPVARRGLASSRPTSSGPTPTPSSSCATTRSSRAPRRPSEPRVRSSPPTSPGRSWSAVTEVSGTTWTRARPPPRRASSKKSLPTRPTRPSTCWSSAKCTRQASPALAIRRSTARRREPVDHRPGLLAVGARGEAGHGEHALGAHDPLGRRCRRAATSRRPPGPAARRSRDRPPAAPGGRAPTRRAAARPRLILEYSATVRSATSASRSTSCRPSACCSRSSNTANIDSSQPMPTTMPGAGSGQTICGQTFDTRRS